MSLQQFLQNDVFRNTLIATPHFEFKIHNGNIVAINSELKSFIGESLNIKDLPVATYGIFDFSLEEQSFTVVFI